MIRSLSATTVINSAGGKSLVVRIRTDKGFFFASVPKGTSKGRHEAKSLPIEKELSVFSRIKDKFVGLDEGNWKKIDKFIQRTDGTGDFRKIGVDNALAISIAVARAAMGNRLWKIGRGGRFPFPVGNIIGGGAHGGGSDWQEFLAIPVRAKTPKEAWDTLKDIWRDVGSILKRKGMLLGYNMEHAHMARLDETRALDMLSEVAESYGARLGIDVAASSFWKGKRYNYRKSGKTMTPKKHFDFVLDTAKKYRIAYLEDPFHEEDFNSHHLLTKELGKRTLVVGDDLYTTNEKRLKKGLVKRATNAMIIKPNQRGTLSQVMDVVRLARAKRITIVPSHRSEETPDNWIADLSVGFGAPLIKIGLGDIPEHKRLVELWKALPKAKMASLKSF